MLHGKWVPVQWIQIPRKWKACQSSVSQSYILIGFPSLTRSLIFSFIRSFCKAAVAIGCHKKQLFIRHGCMHAWWLNPHHPKFDKHTRRISNFGVKNLKRGSFWNPFLRQHLPLTVSLQIFFVLHSAFSEWCVTHAPIFSQRVESTCTFAFNFMPFGVPEVAVFEDGWFKDKSIDHISAWIAGIVNSRNALMLIPDEVLFRHFLLT